MLRRILLASVGALALAGTAFAADLPSRAPPPVYVPPPPTWTGFYVGVNAGYDWSANNSVNVLTVNAFTNTAALSPLGLSTPPAAALGATGSLPVNSSGFIGGGQIGYNFQFANSWVVGLEADFDGIAGAHGSDSVFNATPRIGFAPDVVDSAIVVKKSIDYIGTVRGRFGFLLLPTLLLFGDGGLAYGGVQSSTSIFGGENPFTGTGNWAGFGNTSTTRVGWTAGGGVEWMFLPNWSAKVEYLYYNLGNVTYNVGPEVATLVGGPVAFVNATAARTQFNGNVVRAGINYHFNWGAPPAVVAKY